MSTYLGQVQAVMKEFETLMAVIMNVEKQEHRQVTVFKKIRTKSDGLSNINLLPHVLASTLLLFLLPK